MTETDGLSGLFVGTRRNGVLAWLLVTVLAANLLGGLAIGRYEPVVFSAVAIAIVLAPAVRYRDPTVVPPWYFVLLVCLPIVWEVLAPEGYLGPIVSSLAVATLGLLFVVELHQFTSFRVVPWFAVTLTVLITMAMGGLLSILQWTADVVFGTEFMLDGRSEDAINAAVMIDLIYVTAAGLLAGVIFYLYFRRAPEQADPRIVVPPVRDRGPRDPEVTPTEVDATPTEIVTDDDAEDPEETPAEAAVLSERIGISRRRQRQLAAAMQVVLVAILLYGLWSRQLPVITNAAIAIAITFVPAILERDYGIPIEPGIGLWVTTAVFLHTLGTAGLYDAVAPWDHLTHTLSATVVAAAGYAVLRAIHLHTPRIHLPPWAMFVFTLVFVMAMGVIWEILEFFADQGALLFGLDPVLAQHGIHDTIVDMIFNLVGAIIVATWGTVYLVEVSDELAAKLEAQLRA